MNSSEAEIEAQEGVDVEEEVVEDREEDKGDKVKVVEVKEAAAPPLTVQTGHLCAPGKKSIQHAYILPEFCLKMLRLKKIFLRRWGYCQTRDQPDGDPNAGKCGSSSDCPAWAPTCSKWGYCQESGGGKKGASILSKTRINDMSKAHVLFFSC